MHLTQETLSLVCIQPTSVFDHDINMRSPAYRTLFPHTSEAESPHFNAAMHQQMEET